MERAQPQNKANSSNHIPTFKSDLPSRTKTEDSESDYKPGLIRHSIASYTVFPPNSEPPIERLLPHIRRSLEPAADEITAQRKTLSTGGEDLQILKTAANSDKMPPEKFTEEKTKLEKEIEKLKFKGIKDRNYAERLRKLITDKIGERYVDEDGNTVWREGWEQEETDQPLIMDPFNLVGGAGGKSVVKGIGGWLGRLMGRQEAKKAGKEVVKEGEIKIIRAMQSEILEGSAHEIAKAGGKHSGIYKNHLNFPAERLKRSIRNYEERILEHAQKINNPKKYFDDFDKVTVEELRRLQQKKWPKDLRRALEQRDIMRGILRERGIAID